MSTDNDESRVLVIYTGGTIGMLSGPRGYSPLSGYLSEHLRSQPRFHDPAASSLWANSRSVAAFQSWKSNSPSYTPPSTATFADDSSKPEQSSKPHSDHSEDQKTHNTSEGDRSQIKVNTEAGPKWLDSLVMPESPECPRIRYAILEYEKLIDSAEIETANYLQICHSIQANYHAFDAFVVLHGTDTMSYTASALSFLLENLGKSVILTGAQIPLSSPRNDAVDNLLGALHIGGSYLIPEVSLYFNHQLWRGNRTVKFSSVEFDAFRSFNLEPLIKVGCNVEVRWDLISKPVERQAFKVHGTMCENVAVLRMFPSITPASVRAFLQPPIQGIVLETFGSGNAPQRPQLLQGFKEASERGVVIVNVTQCTKGTVSSDIYETGRALAEVGIVGGRDMTTECALAKLGYLLSKPGLSVDAVRGLIGQSIRGELTPPARVQYEPLAPEDRLKWLIGQMACAGLGARGQASPRLKNGPDLEGGPSEQLEKTSSDIGLELIRSEISREELEQAESCLIPYALLTAAGRSDDSLRQLISAGVPAGLLNHRGSTGLGQTAVHVTAFHGQSQNLDLLLDHGASVHLRDDFGHTPLYYAILNNHQSCIESLEKAGGHLGEFEKLPKKLVQ
ncbi:hypothetical protein CROQUDRAFT_134634 [Cronartium quercuum f. sp. fusiforme G11]|uniref:asparaginase n=1 Tax=Cronartium quercuum f. sp. fusiforme G11 TaxID=708437 RepID=A0A9P6NH28_9BASI|nr:hypothetical protein CROQUDRAFT_134634 [Cronartium quercuum f. sp. fusiforme G11]